MKKRRVTFLNRMASHGLRAQQEAQTCLQLSTAERRQQHLLRQRQSSLSISCEWAFGWFWLDNWDTKTISETTQPLERWGSVRGQKRVRAVSNPGSSLAKLPVSSRSDSELVGMTKPPPKSSGANSPSTNSRQLERFPKQLTLRPLQTSVMASRRLALNLSHGLRARAGLSAAPLRRGFATPSTVGKTQTTTLPNGLTVSNIRKHQLASPRFLDCQSNSCMTGCDRALALCPDCDRRCLH